MNKITTAKVRSVDLQNKERIVQVLQYGAKTADEAGPFGVDSSPPNNTTAIFAETDNNQEPVLIGYINTDQIAEQGEIRLFSVDSEGNRQAFIWLKNDGNIQLNGDTHNTVRFSPLDTALSQMVQVINNNLQLIATGIAGAGGTYTPVNVTLDISSAENETVKIS